MSPSSSALFQVLSIIFLAISSVAASSPLKLARNFVGNDFETDFEFYTADDPTNGYVNYVSRSVASSLGIMASTSSYFRMGVDTATAYATGRGRSSVRIVSRDEFGDGLYVLDVDHMPTGCGTWPAFWTTVMDGWPVGGEIDIIEGSNSHPPIGSPAYSATFGASIANASLSMNSTTASLHTVATCNVEELGTQLGTQMTTTCDASKNNNAGCGVDLGVDTFGRGWNAGQGGYYVLWRDFRRTSSIKVYAFPRGSGSIPSSLLDSSAANIDPSTWTATPLANFSIPNCQRDTFGAHAIVFNIALCGDLAGNTYAGSGCPGMCRDFVQGNPRAFTDAWWGIRGMRVYTSDGKASNDLHLPSWQAAIICLGAIALALLSGFGLAFVLYRSRLGYFRDRQNSIMLEGSEGSLQDGGARASAYYDERHDGASNRAPRLSVPFVDVPFSIEQPLSTPGSDRRSVFSKSSPSGAPLPSPTSGRRPSNASIGTGRMSAQGRNSSYENRLSMASAAGTLQSRRMSTLRSTQDRLSLFPSFSTPAASTTPLSISPRAIMANAAAPKPPLMVGDGGTVWRNPDSALPGETPAVSSMAQYNSLGANAAGGSTVGTIVTGARRGSLNLAGSGSPGEIRRSSVTRSSLPSPGLKSGLRNSGRRRSSVASTSSRQRVSFSQESGRRKDADADADGEYEDEDAWDVEKIEKMYDIGWETDDAEGGGVSPGVKQTEMRKSGDGW